MAKTKRTAEVRDAIIRALELGANRVTAYQAANVSHDTFYKWMADDPAFSEAVKSAEARFVTKNLERIDKAAQEMTWTASAWLLERRRPDDFSQRQRIDVKQLDDATLVRLLAAEADSGSQAPGSDDSDQGQGS